MNERIKILWSEAAESTIGDSWEEQTKFMERFVELIVRECVKLCEHKSNDDEYDQYDMGQSVKAENIRTAIKKHFGVEE
jgi:hypothetical protein